MCCLSRWTQVKSMLLLLPQFDPSFTWNKLIFELAKNRQGREALRLYQKMREEGVIPDHYTYVAALTASTAIADLEAGKRIHAHVNASGLADVFVSTTLLDMYAKCGSIQDARSVFDNTRHRNVVSWTAMIMGYADMDMGFLALQLYACMQHEGVAPNDRTFVAALKACASLAAQADANSLRRRNCLEQGRAIHAEIAKQGFESEIFVANTLVDMYAKCGCITEARHVFERMAHRNVVSWNAIISGYAQMEMGDSALELYARMRHEGFTPDARTFVAALKACASLATQAEGEGAKTQLMKKSYLEQGRAIHAEVSQGGLESNVFIANTLVDMYAKCGSMKHAHQVFKKMRHRSVVSWNAMILGYAQKEMGGLALKLYARMQHEGFIPNARTFVAALQACACLSSLEAGREVHSQIRKVGLQVESFLANCLIDMYSKCGRMWDAKQLFDSLPLRELVTWNALIAGYSGQGDSECVFELYKRMELESIKPDDITFVSVLSVCNHNGLVDKGQTYFQAMLLEYGIFPSCKHYICMIDLLGRVGHLDQAAAMVMKMPFGPDIVTWMSILGACRKWSNVETGKNTFQCAVMLDEKYAAIHVLMTNIYVSAGMWEESAKIEEMGLKIQILEEARALPVDR